MRRRLEKARGRGLCSVEPFEQIIAQYSVSKAIEENDRDSMWVRKGYPACIR
jgi:hypothetical protein